MTSVEEIELPALPARGVVLFPHGSVALAVPEEGLRQLLKAAKGEAPVVAVVGSREPNKEELDTANLQQIGTIGVVMRLVTVSDDASMVAFVHGLHRMQIVGEVQRRPYLVLRVRQLEDVVPPREDPEYLALKRNIADLFDEIVSGSPNLPDGIATMVRNVENASARADLIASFLPYLSRDAAQALLEGLDVRKRMRRLTEELLKERDYVRLRDKIQSEVAGNIDQAQRQFFLREQLKAIQKELGEADEGERDVAELRERLQKASLPEEAAKEAERELSRLQRIPSVSPEHAVARTYLDWLATLPWSHSSETNADVKHAEKILNEDHYGLERVKERILEFLAVHSLRKSTKSPILCFVGPPGVGKTSLGKSIARATGRVFVRISLGGMHDEAEVRGHRRTYVGALPGQIIRGLRRAGTNNPVFMLDEIDKIGKDFRGDPADALLEVLDPEQNFAFRDHYLDVPFDLSKVLFITTANVLDPVAPALRDRMETIELPGYTDEEKLHIARLYLVSRQIEANGLSTLQIRFTEDGISAIIRGYTREAGVRGLERAIASICRKRARQVAAVAPGEFVVTSYAVSELLGVPQYPIEQELEKRTKNPGVAVAVAWTPYGGDVLFIETARTPRDKGELTITGQVGEVMQESAKAAVTWVRANAYRYGLSSRLLKDSEVHLHVPSGAVPKDGPSAGLAMTAALVSLFTERPVRPFVAMTGEITLTGLLLPVGGIKEKVLAARRNHVREIVMPGANEPMVYQEVPAVIRGDLEFHFVESIADALDIVLEPPTRQDIARPRSVYP